jgi:uncharacterized protein (DUF2267 family)
MSEQYERFITTVQQKASINREAAERAAQATLQILAERLSQGEARDLAAQLPEPLAGWLFTDTDAAPFGLEEFLRRVAERECVDAETAERYAHAVLTALDRALLIAAGEVDDLIALLPLELHAPLERGKRRGDGKAVRMSLDDFVRRVAEREGISLEAAREHVAAVLAMLRELLPDAEWRDVTAQLPRDYEALAT